MTRPAGGAASARTAWVELEARAAALIRHTTGNDLAGHLVARLLARPGGRMLALGSSAGALAVEIAAHAPRAAILCIDADSGQLGPIRQRAAVLAVDLRTEEADLEGLELPPGEFDLIFCHTALHNVIALEGLADQLARSLRPQGELVAVDVVTRNGDLMWPETGDVAQAIWQTLPPKFRLNHTAYAAPLIDDHIWQPTAGQTGVRCVRSQDILPILERRFVVEQFVPHFSFSRRFCDTMYGPNYDLTATLDNAVFNWLWELDLYYLTTCRLRPEAFFGVYRVA